MAILNSELQEKLQQIDISFYAGLWYLQEHGNKTKEALVVLQGCSYKIEEVLEFAQSNGLSNAPKVKQTLEELQSKRLKDLAYLSARAHAKSL